MSAHAWPIQVGLYAALSANASLAALIGHPPRIYDEAPASAPFPYVAFGDMRAAAYPGLDGGIEHDVRLSAFSRHGGRREVKTLLDALVEALHEADFPIIGARLISIRFVFADVFRRRDGEIYEGVARFRAVTVPQTDSLIP